MYKVKNATDQQFNDVYNLIAIKMLTFTIEVQ